MIIDMKNKIRELERKIGIPKKLAKKIEPGLPKLKESRTVKGIDKDNKAPTSFLSFREKGKLAFQLLCNIKVEMSGDNNL